MQTALALNAVFIPLQIHLQILITPLCSAQSFFSTFILSETFWVVVEHGG